jgi:phosphatidylinositol alpha-1,6-mannosyltransferase
MGLPRIGDRTAGETGGGAVVLSELFPPVVGGSGELLANVYARLEHVPVTVLTGPAPRGNGDPWSQSRAVNVIRSFTWSAQWGVMHPHGLWRHARRTLALRRMSGRPGTVVHCGRALPEGFDAYLSRQLGGAPYVCWAHGEEIAYAEQSRELRALMQLSYRDAAAVIANSQSTAARLVAFGVPAARIVVAYPGVDAERFRPAATGAAALRARLARSQELVLLTVGRLQRRKGHDLVLRALAGMARDIQPLRYVIVGGGREEARLRQMAAELGVTSQVEFVGEVQPRELPAYYAAADIFVHPNRVDRGDFEGFGIVFLEAAAAGIPVIAGTSGGAPEAVAGGVTGLLVSGTDVDEFATALRALIESPGRRRAMGAAGRARVIAQFSWDAAVKEVAAVHDRVAAAS